MSDLNALETETLAAIAAAADEAALRARPRLRREVGRAREGRRHSEGRAHDAADERARGLGGKSLTWNAVAWRQSHRDFKGKSIDGGGEDWPIDYPDLAPWYEKIEREVGVCGNYDGLKDLRPLVMVAYQPNFIVVHPKIPAGSVKEFIDWAEQLSCGIDLMSDANYIVPN